MSTSPASMAAPACPPLTFTAVLAPSALRIPTARTVSDFYSSNNNVYFVIKINDESILVELYVSSTRTIIIINSEILAIYTGFVTSFLSWNIISDS